MLEQKILTAIRQKARTAPRPISQRRTTPRLIRSLFVQAIPIAALSLAVFLGWRNTQLENQVVVLQQQAKTRVRVLSDSQLVKLASSGNIPIGQAFLTQNGQLMIALKLPEPVVGKTYQAWFIAKSNPKPQTLGTLQNNLDTKVPSNTAAIAISLEPIGGSTTPSEVLGIGEVKF